jgi:hypothetical protein
LHLFESGHSAGPIFCCHVAQPQQMGVAKNDGAA